MSVPIPKGFEDLYFVYRPIKRGFCTLKQLKDGTYTIKDFYILQHMCDLDDYLHVQTAPKD